MRGARENFCKLIESWHDDGGRPGIVIRQFIRYKTEIVIASFKSFITSNKPKWLRSRESRSDSQYVIGMMADRYLRDQ